MRLSSQRNSAATATPDAHSSRLNQTDKRKSEQANQKTAAQRDLMKLDMMDAVAETQREQFDEGKAFLRTSMDLQRIKNQTRQIERVELGYFLKQSRSRLQKIRSGKELFQVIERQKLQNQESLKDLTSARQAVGEQIQGLPGSDDSSSDQDDEDGEENFETNYRMYDLPGSSRAESRQNTIGNGSTRKLYKAPKSKPQDQRKRVVTFNKFAKTHMNMLHHRDSKTTTANQIGNHKNSTATVQPQKSKNDALFQSKRTSFAILPHQEHPSGQSRTMSTQPAVRTEQHIDIDDYFGQTNFDGAREVAKETNISSFFAQKYHRVNKDLRTTEKNSEMAATKAKSSIRNYGVKLQLTQALIKKFQGKEAPNRSQIGLGKKSKSLAEIKGMGPDAQSQVSAYADAAQGLNVTTKSDREKGAYQEKTSQPSHYDKWLQKQDPQESEYAAYMKGLKDLKKNLAHDKDYSHYEFQGKILRKNDKLISNISQSNKKEKSALRAHRLINLVQDKVRQQMIEEMKVADEEAREIRLQKRLEQELEQIEFNKKQRRAFMPMHRKMPDFVESNHKRANFIKGDPQSVKGVLPQGRSFVKKADSSLMRAVPEVKQVINQTVRLEEEVKRRAQKPKNIFEEASLSPLRERLKKQTASSLHPGYHENLGVRSRELELQKSKTLMLKTQGTRQVKIPAAAMAMRK